MVALWIGHKVKTIILCERVVQQVRLYATVTEIGGENPPHHIYKKERYDKSPNMAR